MKTQLSHLLPVENDDEQVVGYIGESPREAGKWFPLDDRRQVLRGFKQPVAKRSARAAVRRDYNLYLSAQEKAGRKAPVSKRQPKPQPQPARAVKFTAVKSSFIKALGYRPEAKLALVEFKSGGIRSYPGVKSVTMQAWLRAPSKGKFFHLHIRPQTKKT
jgi:KTSC domain-containing protein